MLMKDIGGASVMVTGGRGFVGRRVCDAFVAAGAHVFSVNRQVDDSQPNVVQHALDLSDWQATSRWVRDHRPDFICHLASHVYGARDVEMVLPTLHGNLTSTVNLLTAAQTTGIERVVLTGSLEEPDDDDGWPVPSSPYAAAKYAASSYGRMFHALYGMPVVQLRVFMVYGPAQRDEKKLIPYVCNELLAGRRPTLSSGVREVDWIYVDDVAQAYLAACTAPGVEGKTLDAGTGVLTSVRGVVEMLFDIAGEQDGPEFGGLEERALERVCRARVDQARSALGWEPAYALADGLRKTFEYYRQRD